MPHLSRRSTLALAGAAALAGPARAQARLTEVAQFDGQVTGVTVTESGRIFVNFPRWERDVPISVAELKSGKPVAYPDAGWNAWRNAKPLSRGDHFICVQSVVAGPGNMLWVVDPAAPGNEFNLEGGPKLVQIDLGTDRVVRVIGFDRSVVPQGSYLNDVRISPDGQWAYLTDSGVKGALIVVDLGSGQGRRVLDGHPSTQIEPDVTVKTDGRPLKRPDGRGPQFAADGIALDPNGEYLYWQALTGRTLYRISTAALTDRSASPDQVAGAVQRLGTTCVADGYWMDGQGRLFITSPEDDSVKLRRPDGRLEIVVQDKRMRWPDTMSQGADGTLYVTSSHIQDMAQWRRDGRAPKMTTQLWKFRA